MRTTLVLSFVGSASPSARVAGSAAAAEAEMQEVLCPVLHEIAYDAEQDKTGIDEAFQNKLAGMAR
jgi:hypothetical protein